MELLDSHWAQGRLAPGIWPGDGVSRGSVRCTVPHSHRQQEDWFKLAEKAGLCTSAWAEGMVGVGLPTQSPGQSRLVLSQASRARHLRGSGHGAQL